jgi:hypothetical protein
MGFPAVFGALDTNATLGLALAIGWLGVLGISLYQYGRNTCSRERIYMIVSTGGLWLAFSLLQISAALTGVVEKGIVTLAVGLFCAGIAAGVRWWRIRNSGTDASTQA